jgi:acetyl-CoA C-acetyltransferase
MPEAIIVSSVRTPIGSFQGKLSPLTTGKLGGIVVKEVVARSGVAPEQIDEVLMGCVLSGGLGQAPARQATIFGGLPNSIPAVTLSKVCGSGLRTVMMGASQIKAGDSEIVIAGGMESMTNAPYALPKARMGYRMGNGELMDTMVNDGLWDVYNNYHMGVAAELCATEMKISREAQDEFAIASYKKAIASIEAGLFKNEIVPVEIPQRRGDPLIVDTDEEPFRAKLEKIPSLRPAFKKDGTVTAANASSINDGASAVLMMTEEKARAMGVSVGFRVVASASHAQAPEWFTTAPAYAINKVLAKAGLTSSDIDLFEINEAFAVVSLAVNEICGLDPSRINVRGGAIALGHPIGASGNRILVTLLHAMEASGAKRGLTSLCIGGGEAAAVIVERII